MRPMRRFALTEADLNRFWRFVKKTATCWEWTGASCNSGYGKYGNFSIKAIGYPAHRIAYHALKGDLRPGLHIDHLCRNTLCVNPNHLEQVTPRENTIRGVGPSAANTRKTKCSLGHRLSSENTIIRNHGKWRGCKKCQLAAEKRYRERRKARLVEIEEVK